MRTGLLSSTDVAPPRRLQPTRKLTTQLRRRLRPRSNPSSPRRPRSLRLFAFGTPTMVVILQSLCFRPARLRAQAVLLQTR